MFEGTNDTKCIISLVDYQKTVPFSVSDYFQAKERFLVRYLIFLFFTCKDPIPRAFRHNTLTGLLFNGHR